MKIAYVTEGNPYDKNSWSGTDYYTRKALEDAGNEVYCISVPRPSRYKKLITKCYYKLIRGGYSYERSVEYCKECARYIEKQLQPDTDAVFGMGSFVVSMLRPSSTPMFFYTDGVYSLTAKMYTYFEKMPRWQKLEQDVIEKAAMDRCAQAFVSSDCVESEMISVYGMPPAKVCTIPMGANIDIVPDANKMESIIAYRIDNPELNILFVGVDYYRKGADIVIDAIRTIHERGGAVRLHLVGCRNIPCQLPDYVIDHGFISKNSPAGYAQLMKLYEQSHFLFVPSRGECYGLVFCEASAFGLPSISHNVGGIPTIVKNGRNGYLFDIGSDSQMFADRIIETWNDKTVYSQLCHQSRQEYDARLNWTVAGRRLTEEMKKALGEKV